MTDIRHWKRAEPDGTTMYFATATNAGHDKATKDERATSISADEYYANVPKETVRADAPKAVNGSEKVAAADPTPAPANPKAEDISAKQAAWGSLEDWTKHYSQFINVQDMIAMFALQQHHLCNAAFHAMEEYAKNNPAPKSN